MYVSLFKKYLLNGLESISKVIEKVVNAKDTHYEFKKYLTPEESIDMTFKSLTASGLVVAADMVAMDSPLSPSRRGSLGAAEGNIEKMGKKYPLNETQLQNLKSLEGRGGKEAAINKILFNDVKSGAKAIFERVEFNFLQALSTGMGTADIENNTGTIARLDFGVPKSHKLGASISWKDKKAKIINDINRVLDLSDDGLGFIWLDQATFNLIRSNDQVKEYYSALNNLSRSLIIKKADLFDFFQEEFGLTLRVMGRKFLIEKEGKAKSVTPWEAGAVTFTTSDKLGNYFYTVPAEFDNKDTQKGIIYKMVDKFIMISMYRILDPSYSEVTKAQAFVTPVLANGPSTFILNSLEVIKSDPSKEGNAVESDKTITIYGESLVKKDVVTAYNNLEEVASTTTSIGDAKLIIKINELNDDQKVEFKIALGL